MKDALDRRSRFSDPQPGSYFSLQPRDFALLQALDRHGHLPTPYLYAFTKDLGKDYLFLKKRLTQLFNGFCEHPDHRSNHPDGHVCKTKHFVDRERSQFLNAHARYQHLVYSLTPYGKAALGESAAKFIRRSSSFVHDFFASCLTASFDLTTRFIHRDEILAHPKCPPIHGDPFRFDDLIPDDMFGIENGGKYHFFALEVDRATERVNTTKDVTASIAKKVKGYEQVFAHKLYRERFGLPNFTVLFATTSEARVQTMLEHVKKHAERPDRYLFKAFPDFGEVWRVPKEPLDVREWRNTESFFDVAASRYT
jgi:hypothetical protein